MSEAYADVALERALLGGVINLPECWDAAITEADGRCFTGAVRPMLWDLVGEMYREKTPVDPLTVMAKARERGVPADALAEEVPNWHGFPSAQLVVNYAKSLRNLGVLRLAREHAAGFLNQPLGDGPTQIAGLLKALSSIGFGAGSGNIVTISQIMEEMISALEAEERGDAGTQRISTGFAELDRLVNGFMPGLLQIYAGRPGGGKSALAVAFICALGLAGVPTAVFWLEDIRRMLALRVASYLSETPTNAMLHGTNMAVGDQRNWWPEVTKAANMVEKWPVYIESSLGLTKSQMTQRMRCLSRERGVRVFITDHLGRMKVDGTERHDMELGAIAQEYLEESMTLNACPVAFHQLGKRAEDGGKEALGWLFNSDFIAQHARVVGYVGNHDDMFRINLVKATYGVKGGVIRLGWDGTRMRVYEPSKEQIARWDRKAPAPVPPKKQQPKPAQQSFTEPEEKE